MRNPLTAARDLDDRRRIQALFPGLDTSHDTPILALRPYVNGCPERFFNRAVHLLMLRWLSDRDGRQRGQLQQYFADADAELSAAMLFLRQINSEDWHDGPLIGGDDYDIVRFIDRILNPAYLRLTEGVFAHLIRPVAYFARLDRGKATDGLDVFNMVDELRGGPMARCADAYQQTVRNGIGHGGITFLDKGIRYRDKKGNAETLDLRSVVRLCDDMIDTCNALASALKLFLILVRSRGYRMPHELLVEALMEATHSPWWSISGCIRTELPGATQLVVYAHPNSRDRLKIQWAAVHTAALAESLAPGFDRYFLSLRDRRNRPGWSSFDGERLSTLRLGGASEAHEYATALDQAGFFHDPKPALLGPLRPLDTLVQSLRLHLPALQRELREKRGHPEMLGRDARIHRNSWGYVLNGAVVIPGLDRQTGAAIIREHRRRILQLAARTARSEASRWSLPRYLPLGYARIGVFSHDFRRRRLNSFGLGPELVCTIQVQRIRRIKAPDIFGATVETFGNWRIAWNRSWIESGGRIDQGARALR